MERKNEILIRLSLQKDENLNFRMNMVVFICKVNDSNFSKGSMNFSLILKFCPRKKKKIRRDNFIYLMVGLLIKRNFIRNLDFQVFS